MDREDLDLCRVRGYRVHAVCKRPDLCFKAIPLIGSIAAAHSCNYSPGIGRWLTPDPLADKYPAYSPYNYVLGNPLGMIDPDGRAPDWPKVLRGLWTASGGIMEIGVGTAVIPGSGGLGTAVGVGLIGHGGLTTMEGARTIWTGLMDDAIKDPTNGFDMPTEYGGPFERLGDSMDMRQAGATTDAVIGFASGNPKQAIDEFLEVTSQSGQQMLKSLDGEGVNRVKSVFDDASKRFVNPAETAIDGAETGCVVAGGCSDQQNSQ